MLKEVQEVKVGGRTRRVYVRPFAWNLHAPTHMEWTPDGRLLVVERTTGKVKDVTKGGDMEEAKPFAWGLQGPSSMCPLPDGRILITEFWGGRIRDISVGGPSEKLAIYAEDLSKPYSLALDALGRLLVTEHLGHGVGRISILASGKAVPLVQGVPSVETPGFEGYTPPHAWPDRWEGFVAGCGKWGTDPKVFPDRPYVFAVSIGGLGLIVGVPEDGGHYEALAPEHTFARGLGWTGGMIAHPFDGMLYVTQPLQGEIRAINPRESRNYRFDPPVVSGIPMASCVRFTPDWEKMLVCSPQSGAIWQVEGFSD